MRIDNKNTFERALSSGINLFLGAGFSILAKDANGNYLVTMGLFDTVLYDVVEIPDMKEYTMRITLNDPAASISKDFRIQVDYILFEPIN